ncbi:transposase [Aurantiacibacter sp. DGU5]|uniref:Transposase n=1 Tax=Aurantiacibacter flavus TaxID=3145232 RepID=A0ABV0CRW2_9SPHN
MRQSGTPSLLRPDRRRGIRLHCCRATDHDPGCHAQGAARGQACPELVEGGYGGNRFRESLLIRGILPITPPRTNRKVPEHSDYRRYKDRNRIERMFNTLKQSRRIATRYDKTALSFASFLNLASIRFWLKPFVNKAWAEDHTV